MSDTAPLTLNRSASGGTVLYFPEFVADNEELRNSSFLTYKEKETLAILIEVQNHLDEQNTISVNEIAELHNFVPQTFRGRLRNFRTKGLLKKIDFSFADGSYRAKVVCETLDLTPLIIGINGKSKPENKPPINKPRWNIKAALEKEGHGMLPKVTKENLPMAVRHMGNNPIEQLINQNIRKKGRGADKDKVPDREEVRFFYVKGVDRSEKIPARIKSYNNIMDPEDLQVLYCCYSLIYHFHKDKLEKHFMEGTLPRNLTPVHINHIIDLLGRWRSGPNRAYVRDCLQAIADTAYDLHRLGEVEFEDGSLSGYAQETFRNFESFSPLSDKAPEVDKKTGRILFGEGATIFLIKLPQGIFERLMQQDTLFAFPQNALAANAFLFTLYLRFRALCKDKGYDDRISDLHKKLAPKQSLKSFKKTIRTAFKEMPKVKDNFLWAKYDDIEDIYHFNIWGYHGRLSFKENYMSVTCHESEMLTCCNAEPELNAPVVNNELSTLYYNQRLEKSIARQLGASLDRRFLKFSVTYASGAFGAPSEILIHKYTTEQAFDDAVEAISETHFVDHLAIEIQIKADMENISGLEIAGRELEESEFYYLLKKLHLDLDHRQIIGFIQRIHRKKKLHNDLFEVTFNGVEPSLSLLKQIATIKQRIIQTIPPITKSISEYPESNLESIEEALFTPLQ